MFRSVLLAAVSGASFLAAPALAQTEEIVGLFGKATAAWGAEVAPDGSHVAMGCAPLGPPAICIYDLKEAGKPQLFQIPPKMRLTTFYWASPKHIIVKVNVFDTLHTSSGLKNYRFDRAVSFNIETKKNEILMGKAAKGYTYASSMPAFMPSKPDTVLMQLPYSSQYELFEVDLNSGNSKLKDRYREGIWDVIVDGEGKAVAEVEYNPSFSYQVTGSRTSKGASSDTFKVIASATGKTIYERPESKSAPLSIWGLAPDGQDLIAFVDTDEMYGLKIMSIDDGSLSDVTIEGESVGGVSAVMDSYTNEAIGISYTDDLDHEIFFDPAFKSLYNELNAVFPDQVVRISSWTPDKNLMTVVAESPGQPVDYYLFDNAGPSVSPLGNGAPQLAGTTLGKIEAIQYKAEDGLEIEGYLTLPPGKTKADGPFPLVLMPHGGPEARDTATFDWWAQAYAAAGYAVLQPNFRGSDGYGQAFRNKGYGEFGGKMITDSLDGANWAIAEGIARDSGYCIVGASYGGYAALQGAVLGGDKVKCAVSVNGVADPIRLTNDYDDDSGTFVYWKRYMGIDRFSTDEERNAITPKDRVSEISAQILSLHGKEDTTVEYDQAVSFDRAMEGRSNFRLVTMDGEDHYLRSSKARETVLRESLNFLAEHLPVN